MPFEKGAKSMKVLIGADVVPTKETEELFIAGDVNDLFGDICDLIKQADERLSILNVHLQRRIKRLKNSGCV